MAKRKGTEEVSIEIITKDGVSDEGSMRAIAKIIENREVVIMISKGTIKELAKAILDGEQEEPSEPVRVRLECNYDKQDVGKSHPRGKVIAC